jgi:leucyl/phenylalanyl-tRNA--protein transferase
MSLGNEFSSFFKDPHIWKKDLVAVGGDFSPERLFYAYTHGIFPWSENPIRWFCLDSRAIFDLNNTHFSKTTLRKIRQKIYKISYNQCFRDVMVACAHRPNEETWITGGFLDGYENFHRAGYAHSVEAWNAKGELVGGVYGVAIGKLFAGESMFSFSSDAGKVALWHLFEALKFSEFQLFDTQQLNHITWELGAYEIPKKLYLERLELATQTKNKWAIEPQFLQTHSVLPSISE